MGVPSAPASPVVLLLLSLVMLPVKVAATPGVSVLGPDAVSSSQGLNVTVFGTPAVGPPALPDVLTSLALGPALLPHQLSMATSKAVAGGLDELTQLVIDPSAWSPPVVA